MPTGSLVSSALISNWWTCPGDVLLELLKEREYSQAELARQSDWTTKHINQVVRGKVNISVQFAIMLEETFGSPNAEFWMAVQARWEIRLYRGQ